MIPISKLKMLKRALTKNLNGMVLHMSADFDLLHEQFGSMPLEDPWIDIFVPTAKLFATDMSGIKQTSNADP
jgi:hypothetical protein